MTNIEVGDTVHIINRRRNGALVTTHDAAGVVDFVSPNNSVRFEGTPASMLYSEPRDGWEVEIISIEKPYVIGGIYEMHRPSQGATLRRRVEGGWQMLNSDAIYTDEQHKGWGDAVQRRVLIIDYPDADWASKLSAPGSMPGCPWTSGAPAGLIHDALIKEKEAHDA